MDGDDEVRRLETGRCPRCELCGCLVRVRGMGRLGVWCAGCMGGALPFAGLVGEGEFSGPLGSTGRGLGLGRGSSRG